MEEFNNCGGGFFTVDEEDNAGVYNGSIDDMPNEYDSEPENLNRSNMQVPPITDSVKRTLKRQIYAPITCKIFKSAAACPDDIFFCDGLFFKDICIIGRVISIQTSSKNMRIMVNDNTGIVEVTVLYKDYESLPLWAKKIKENEYFKFFGQAKLFKDKKSLLAANASKIADFNELTHHFLNVTLNQCIRDKGVLSPMEIKEGKRLLQESNEESKDTNEQSFDTSEEVKSTPIPAKISQSSSEPRMFDIKERILETIRDILESGAVADVNSIYKKIPIKISRAKFDSAIALLSEEMIIMSTDGNFSFSLV